MSALLQEQADPARVYRVLIIGAGFSGIGMAINLRQRGEQDFLILEQEAGVGGTWWVNQYPGCACDIPSHLYSFSFEPNPDWSRRFRRSQRSAITSGTAPTSIRCCNTVASTLRSLACAGWKSARCGK